MEYRVTDANDIDMLMDVRLSMLRIVNDLPADYIFDDELVVSSRRYFLEGDQTTVVAVDDGRCVACASMSYIEIMPTFSHPSGKRAHLMNVYTEESYRRRGIARQLVNMLIEDARAHGATEISLDATESGRPLYESMGFKASEECMVIGIQQL
ncbi:MAG: GNAT family N-acetyltransferase [Clostridiales bacterium]|nr:GNAT family N-acetyltransferase [Clostridiales bacterium]